MKSLGYREVRAIADTVCGLLIADYTTIRIFPFVAIVPIAIIVVALAILVILALIAILATTASTAFSHTV
jgi:hypothetical protein